MHKNREESVNWQFSGTFFISTALSLCLAGLLVTSYYYPRSLNATQQLLTQLAWESNNPELITKLSQHYLEHGLSQQARILTNPFVSSVAAIAPASQVLGAYGQNITVIQPLSDTDLFQRQLYWEQVALQHPKYRDAWIQLYYLHQREDQQPYFYLIIIILVGVHLWTINLFQYCELTTLSAL